MRKVPVSTSGRAVIKTGAYMCEFTNMEGIVRSVSTGCRDKDGAQARLAKLLRREERKRAEILSPDEERAADASGTPLTKYIDAYAQ